MLCLENQLIIASLISSLRAIVANPRRSLAFNDKASSEVGVHITFLCLCTPLLQKSVQGVVDSRTVKNASLIQRTPI